MVSDPEHSRNAIACAVVADPNGGAATHTIRTPASARTYTATFRKARR